MAKRTAKSRQRRDTFRVLFSCVGRRVELIESFRRAGEALGLNLKIHGADGTDLAPAMRLVDRAHVIAPIAKGKYVSQLCGIVKQHRIDLLIPLIDSELPILAGAVDRFARLGCTALISSPEVVATTGDKLAWYDCARRAGIDTPKTWAYSDALKRKRIRFPLFMKPRFGSAGKGNYIIDDRRALQALGSFVEEPIVQEYLDGDEYTLDVYTGLDGCSRCVVPRKRIEVRSGEVSKALIVKREDIQAVGHRVTELFGTCRGVVTVQCIDCPDGRIAVIEVNPRFGGGVPLAIHAGADFPKWILAELTGRQPGIRRNSFADDVAMLRFDDSLFVKRASRGKRR